MSAGFDTSIYKLPQQESVENRLLALGRLCKGFTDGVIGPMWG